MKSEKLVKTQICCWKKTAYECVKQLVMLKSCSFCKIRIEDPVSHRRIVCASLINTRSACIKIHNPVLLISGVLLTPDFCVCLNQHKLLVVCPRHIRLFFLCVVSSLTGRPAERASKGNRKYTLYVYTAVFHQHFKAFLGRILIIPLCLFLSVKCVRAYLHLLDSMPWHYCTEMKVKITDSANV